MLGERFEKNYPWLISLASLGFLPMCPWIAPHQALVTAAITKLFSPALNVSAIAVGFLATSQSILISLKDAPGMIKMKADGYFEPFVDFLSVATASSFVLAIISGMFSALDFSKGDKLHAYLQVVWIAFAFFTLSSYYRAVSLLPYVLRDTVPRCANLKNRKPPFNPNE